VGTSEWDRHTVIDLNFYRGNTAYEPILHTMKALAVFRGNDPRILHLGSTYRCVVSFTLQLLHPHRKSPRYPVGERSLCAADLTLT